jgi:hypothetical protein
MFDLALPNFKFDSSTSSPPSRDLIQQTPSILPSCLGSVLRFTPFGEHMHASLQPFTLFLSVFSLSLVASANQFFAQGALFVNK